MLRVEVKLGRFVDDYVAGKYDGEVRRMRTMEEASMKTCAEIDAILDRHQENVKDGLVKSGPGWKRTLAVQDTIGAHSRPSTHVGWCINTSTYIDKQRRTAAEQYRNGDSNRPAFHEMPRTKARTYDAGHKRTVTGQHGSRAASHVAPRSIYEDQRQCIVAEKNDNRPSKLSDDR